MTVDDAWAFFADEPAVRKPLALLRDIGLGYLRLGQPATELSGGEAQRIKLATELQRPQRGDTLYVLDEPSTGLHPSDVDRLMAQLQGLVDAGNTVVVVEHEMRLVAASDWVIDMGPGAGEEGGRSWRAARRRWVRHAGRTSRRAATAARPCTCGRRSPRADAALGAAGAGLTPRTPRYVDRARPARRGRRRPDSTSTRPAAPAGCCP